MTRPAVTFRTVEISNPKFETEELREITVKSPLLGQRADITVHAPARARTTRDAPLVLLLHGVYGSHWSWVRQGGAHRLNAELQRDENFPAFVLAMPSDGLWGDGSGYLPHQSQNFERWIVDEVPAAAALAVPSVTPDSSIFIAGLSMGGFGALRLAGKYPQRFAGASAHSAITEFDQLGPLVEDSARRFRTLGADHSVADALLRHRTTLPPIRFDCGAEDPLLSANRTLHHVLDDSGVPHVYEELSGAHNWAYWIECLPKTLQFFATAHNGRPRLESQG